MDRTCGYLKIPTEGRIIIIIIIVVIIIMMDIQFIGLSTDDSEIQPENMIMSASRKIEISHGYLKASQIKSLLVGATTTTHSRYTIYFFIFFSLIDEINILNCLVL